MPEIKKLIKKDDPVILDIGANDGGDTVKFLKAFTGARVFCFEPNPKVAAEFREKIKDPRCELFELAISDKDGETEFYLSSAGSGKKGRGDASSSIKKPAGHMKVYPGIEFKETVTVKTKRLDTWAQQNNISQIDFIWADVQGAEGELIRGGLATLNEKTNYFYTEIYNKELYAGQINLKGVLGLLPNFALLRIYGHNVLLKNRAKRFKAIDHWLFFWERLINFKNHLTGNIYRI